MSNSSNVKVHQPRKTMMEKLEKPKKNVEKKSMSNDWNLIMAEEKDDGDNKMIILPLGECDIFRGEWVSDNGSHPLYKEERCEFLMEMATCLKHGRLDSLCQKWRWQPRDNSFPRTVAGETKRPKGPHTF